MIKVLAFVAVVFTALPAHGQTFIESQNQIVSSSAIPTIDAQLEIPGTGVNAYSWFLVSQGWGEALVGVSKQINSVWWVSLAAGVETDEHPLRVSPSVFFSQNRVTVFATVEEGGSGFWYKSLGTVRVVGQLEIGYHSQRFYGTGPMARLTLGHKVAVWGSVVKNSATLGVIKTF